MPGFSPGEADLSDRRVTDCCIGGNRLIEWREAGVNCFAGPKQDGWAIFEGKSLGYFNVSFCPFCGKKLEKSNPE